jgi:poly(3-hydroxybutyrate) depolymerase
MAAKPVKITGTATGTKDKKAVNFKNVGKISKTVTKVTEPVKKTSRPGTADKQKTKQGGKVTITGSATGTKSLTAAQVAKMNKMTSKYKMGNR